MKFDVGKGFQICVLRRGLDFHLIDLSLLKWENKVKRVLKGNINLTLEMDCLIEKLLKLETKKFAMIRERSEEKCRLLNEISNIKREWKS